MHFDISLMLIIKAIILLIMNSCTSYHRAFVIDFMIRLALIYYRYSQLKKDHTLNILLS